MQFDVIILAAVSQAVGGASMGRTPDRARHRGGAAHRLHRLSRFWGAMALRRASHRRSDKPVARYVTSDPKGSASKAGRTEEGFMSRRTTNIHASG